MAAGLSARPVPQTCRALSVLILITAVLATPPRLAASDGAELLYRRHCAACHGEQGRGDGPAARSLCPAPADLTKLKLNIPELMRLIDGRRTIRAHGSASMPVWGEVFEQSLIGEPRRRRTALRTVEALADYVFRMGRSATPPNAE